MATRKTSVEIDEELLAETRSALATKTVRDTIEEAFREVLRGVALREEVRALSEMEGMDLADPQIMAQAWR